MSRSPAPASIELDGMVIDVVRKDVKHVRLTIVPPDGRVRISAPKRMSQEAITALAVERLGWIRRQQAKMRERHRAEQRWYVAGEVHRVWGRSYPLVVWEGRGAPKVTFDGETLALSRRAGSEHVACERAFFRWHRRIVELAASALIEAYEPLLGVKVAGLQVRRMKTRWGSCTPAARTIRLNVDLATRPPECLHYVVVHEMLHILQPGHGPRFHALLDDVMPGWRATRALLKEDPPSA